MRIAEKKKRDETGPAHDICTASQESMWQIGRPYLWQGMGRCCLDTAVVRKGRRIGVSLAGNAAGGSVHSFDPLECSGDMLRDPVRVASERRGGNLDADKGQRPGKLGPRAPQRPTPAAQFLDSHDFGFCSVYVRFMFGICSGSGYIRFRCLFGVRGIFGFGICSGAIPGRGPPDPQGRWNDPGRGQVIQGSSYLEKIFTQIWKSKFRVSACVVGT